MVDVVMVDWRLTCLSCLVFSCLRCRDMGAMDLAESSDPRVGARFDTVVVQALSAGAIVIAQRHGTVAEIVKHDKHGFLASSLNDYYKSSVWVMNAPHETLDAIRWAAAARAAVFDPFQSINKMSALFKTSIEIEHFHQFVAKHLAAVQTLKLSAALPGTTDRMAVILVNAFEAATEFTIRHTIHQLGPQWQLTVYVTDDNVGYYREVLGNIENIQFLLLPRHIESTELIETVMLKSMGFWEACTATNVLIFNSNSLISHPNFDTFMSYDFIGAPVAIPQKHGGPRLAMSGSCSLRKVSAMKAMIEKYGAQSTYAESEADFFYRAMQTQGETFTLPTAQVANDFSIAGGFPDLKSFHTPVCMNNPWQNIKAYKEIDIERWMDQAIEDLL
jgi:hypothetical protein